MAVWKPGITAQIKENKNSAVEIPGLALHEDRNYGTRQEKAIWCRNIAGQEPPGSLRITAPISEEAICAVKHPEKLSPEACGYGTNEGTRKWCRKSIGLRQKKPEQARKAVSEETTGIRE